MRYPRILIPFAADTRDSGTVGLTGMVSRLFCTKSMTHLPEFTKQTIEKQDYAAMIPNDDPRVKAWIASNCEAHAPYVTRMNPQTALWGRSKGKTAILVLSGPSASGIRERIEPYRSNPDVKVFTLNKSAQAVPDADYFVCYEQLCPPEYFNHLDPERTTLLTAPCARAELAAKWKGKNAYYAYMGDMRAPEDKRWEHLPLVVSALATCVPTLQTIYNMGFKNVLIVGADFAMANPESSPEAPVSGGVFYFDGTRWDRFKGPENGSYYNGTEPTLFYGINGTPCASWPMMYRHSHAFACTMEILIEAGLDVRNCSEHGVLDFHCANLEKSLVELHGAWWTPQYQAYLATLVKPEVVNEPATIVHGEAPANVAAVSGVVVNTTEVSRDEHAGNDREAASSADCVLA